MKVEIKFVVDIESEDGEGLGNIIDRAIKKYPIPKENIKWASITTENGGVIMGF